MAYFTQSMKASFQECVERSTIPDTDLSSKWE